MALGVVSLVAAGGLQAEGAGEGAGKAERSSGGTAIDSWKRNPCQPGLEKGGTVCLWSLWMLGGRAGSELSMMRVWHLHLARQASGITQLACETAFKENIVMVAKRTIVTWRQASSRHPLSKSHVWKRLWGLHSRFVSGRHRHNGFCNHHNVFLESGLAC